MYTVTRKSSGKTTILTDEDFKKDYGSVVNMEFFVIPFTKHVIEVDGEHITVERIA